MFGLNIKNLAIVQFGLNIDVHYLDVMSRGYRGQSPPSRSYGLIFVETLKEMKSCARHCICVYIIKVDKIKNLNLFFPYRYI